MSLEKSLRGDGNAHVIGRNHKVLSSCCFPNFPLNGQFLQQSIVTMALLLGQPKALAAAVKVNGKSHRKLFCQWQFSNVAGEAAVCVDDFCGRMGRRVVLSGSNFRRDLEI